MENHEQIEERYIRQRDIVPYEKLQSCRATVVGVGAIGRQAALQLAAMGIPWLQIVDFDTVEIHNLASQGYLQDDFDRPKVEATADLCHQINHQLEVHIVNSRFRGSLDIGNILFCCVDRIETRKLVWNATKDRVNFFSDGRMGAEIIRILTAYDFPSQDYYPSTLFASEEAYAAPCTAKTTIYCANIAAGLMLSQFTRRLRCLPVSWDLSLNLLTDEISIADEPKNPS